MPQRKAGEVRTLCRTPAFIREAHELCPSDPAARKAARKAFRSAYLRGRTDGMSIVAIRLACTECDRDDHDYVDELPEDWKDIVYVGLDNNDESGQWWTYLGTCPECAKDEADAAT